MKRLFVLFMALAVILAASMAFASVQDFEKFTVDIPDEWTATPDGSTVGIIKNDNTASISITVESMEGVSLKELADAYVEAMDGSNLTLDGDSYVFDTANPNGVDMKCILSGDGTNYALMVITGFENAPEEIAAIISSMQEK